MQSHCQACWSVYVYCVDVFDIIRHVIIYDVHDTPHMSAHAHAHKQAQRDIFPLFGLANA